MVNLNNSEIRISMLEKLVVNWAILPDALYYSMRSALTKDRYHDQSFQERLGAVWHGRINRYHKLLEIKRQYGEIPEKVQEICRNSPCGYTRLKMANIRMV